MSLRLRQEFHVGNPTNIADMLGRNFESPNSNDTPTVFLIAKDNSEQETLKSLIAREGWQFETFESAREFLARARPLVPSCLILGFSIADLSSLEVQKQIVRERAEVPIIVIARYADVPTTVQAMKAGAVDFLMTPFSSELLLSRMRESLEHSRLALHREMEIRDLRNCYDSLSRRERQVMVRVVSGLLNKQVGGELGISEITVKKHRRQVMQKMKANSLPDLVRIAADLELARKVIHLREGIQIRLLLYDLLFQAYTSEGKKDLARRDAQKALELLPSDKFYEPNVHDVIKGAVQDSLK